MTGLPARKDRLKSERPCANPESAFTYSRMVQLFTEPLQRLPHIGPVRERRVALRGWLPFLGKRLQLQQFVRFAKIFRRIIALEDEEHGGPRYCRM